MPSKNSPALLCSLAALAFSLALSLPLAAADQPADSPAKNPPATTAASAPSPALTPEDLAAKFPYPIKISWVDIPGGHPGDQLIITSVRGDRKKIEDGGTYWIQGTYTLSSDSVANITVMHDGRNISRPEHPDSARFFVERGNGTFSLVKFKGGPGDLHLSFLYARKPLAADKKVQHWEAFGGGIRFH